MPVKTKNKSTKKSTNNKNAVNMLIVAVCVLVVGVLGYTILKNNTSLFSNDSVQAEEKATPEQLAFTAAEKAAADAEPEASSTTIFNQGSVYLNGCRYQHPNGWWGVQNSGYRTIVDESRVVIIISVNRNRVIERLTLPRYRITERTYYGEAKSGYIKFLIGQTGAYKVMKFNTLPVC